jgi:hypothetical protein
MGSCRSTQSLVAAATSRERESEGEIESERERERERERAEVLERSVTRILESGGGLCVACLL